ncbi:Uncharacterised protein [Mycobacteroides abscessus subsp. abscessus]|nr:Uncharacterised protein [Mycobacteroides abscessus subsp. abscessus]
MRAHWVGRVVRYSSSAAAICSARAWDERMVMGGASTMRRPPSTSGSVSLGSLRSLVCLRALAVARSTSSRKPGSLTVSLRRSTSNRAKARVSSGSSASARNSSR